MLGQLYGLLLLVMFLFALAASIPVLVGIFREGRERRRKRQAGEMERYTEDEEYGVGHHAPDEADFTGLGQLTCPHCGATNDAEFGYCRDCAESL
jgi:hypothetical protein